MLMLAAAVAFLAAAVIAGLSRAWALLALAVGLLCWAVHTAGPIRIG